MKTVREQMHQRIDEEKEFDKIKYGEVTFKIQDGKVLSRDSLDKKKYED